MAKRRKPPTMHAVTPDAGDVKAIDGALCVRFQSAGGKRVYYLRVPLALVLKECRKAGAISADALRPRLTAPLKEPRT